MAVFTLKSYRIKSKWKLLAAVHWETVCPYLQFFWSVFSRIRTEYGEILRIFPYAVRMRENTDQNNYKYRHFLRSDSLSKTLVVESISKFEHLQFGKFSQLSTLMNSVQIYKRYCTNNMFGGLRKIFRTCSL